MRVVERHTTLRAGSNMLDSFGPIPYLQFRQVRHRSPTFGSRIKSNGLLVCMPTLPYQGAELKYNSIDMELHPMGLLE